MADLTMKPLSGALARFPGRPAWTDPRWVFAGLLTLYAALGCTVLGFRDPWQIALTVAGCMDAFALCPPFTRWQGGRRSRPAHPR